LTRNNLLFHWSSLAYPHAFHLREKLQPLPSIWTHPTPSRDRVGLRQKCSCRRDISSAGETNNPPMGICQLTSKST
jgi:hypothetical protein